MLSTRIEMLADTVWDVATEFGKGCAVLIVLFSSIVYLLTNKLVHGLQYILDFAKKSWSEMEIVIWEVINDL